ncbi:hypothetical protein SERLA73DRAFT_190662 [Serpula lacrymans var. lacrymans S7.3]|uniref:NmrA-like domain-containing protein n=2 Tax=Serpula lacrymans var. lacrymans TaxID=341189 RepID=F8QG53_SERL3|nr:uncharacterized protein SERLADRAFT_478923 [Serpula lacrymans var. lacrymans S7.9]EGN92668.1 hypothetical protein SERLA73DRAFT_190662 [Serpula lacrymans var. lacrymans S7.3]EGO19470.1 hypothetical protein SERLADRAFT_478923 [Serpula lacrymans var. lacrymans S7.9]
MSESTYKTVAVAGAGPNLGLPIVRALLAHNLSVIVLVRPSSTRELPAGTRVVAVDYSDVLAATSVLREHHVDVVVSAVSSEGLLSQMPLAQAAKAAGVKLFVPPEFGMPTEGGTEGFALAKSQFVDYLKSIGLPFARVYCGLFYEYIPWLTGVPDTGKFLIVGSGKVPASFTAIEDVAGFLAHILTTLPPSKLHDTSFRIEGQRGSLAHIAKFYEGIAPVEYVNTMPDGAPGAQARGYFPSGATEVRDYFQQKVEKGAVSVGYDPALGREGEVPVGHSNALWEGHQWKTVKEVLDL